MGVPLNRPILMVLIAVPTVTLLIVTLTNSSQKLDPQPEPLDSSNSSQNGPAPPVAEVVNNDNAAAAPEPKQDSNKDEKKKKQDTRCYHHRFHSEPSILDSEPKKGKSIFFIETSCHSEEDGKISIKSRQACAVESAARLNPNLEIWLLYVSPGVIKYEGTESDRYLQAILSYDNVKIRHLDMGEYFKGTLVENLWLEGKIEKSNYVYSHTSDVLRFLTMWRYGGIYMDLDIIVQKSLEDLPLNFACIESKVLVGSTVLSFDPEGEGHELAEMTLKDLHSKFNGADWTNNGPGCITRLGKTICKAKNVTELFGKTCRGFTFYKSEVFLPVPWNHWEYFFDMKYMKKVESMSKDSYSVHIWNNLNTDKHTRKDVDTPHTVLSKKYCPKVFQETDEYF